MKLTTPALIALTVLCAYLAGARSRSDDNVEASSALTVVSPAEASEAPLFKTRKQGYVCPMHSHITSDHEGPCPICGMDLVPQKADAMAGDTPETSTPAGGPPAAADAHGALAGAAIRLDPRAQEHLGVRLALATRGEMQREVRTVGKITRVDSTARNVLASPIAGRLEIVADKAEGDSVQQGELLFTVSSDELMKLERDYQAASQNNKPDEATTLAQTLMDSGLDADQIAQLQGGAEPTLPASFRAQQDSFVFFRRGTTGEEVTPGFTVFNLGGDKRLVEVTAEIYEQQWGWVQEGQEAEMVLRGLPGKTFTGKVVRVDPPVGFTTRTLEVRIEFETDDEGVSQNVFAHVTIKGQGRDNIVMVPSESVIRTEAGDRVVAVRKDGVFQSMPIVAGEEADGMTEVISGLAGGESIVVSGQFLIDSESSRLADLARISKASGMAGHNR